MPGLAVTMHGIQEMGNTEKDEDTPEDKQLDDLVRYIGAGTDNPDPR